MIYKPTLYGLIKFELLSFLGRMARCDKPDLSAIENYLNLGCGQNYVAGMINADFFSGYRFWKRQRKLEWRLDLRYPLLCEDLLFDGVFTEHTLEHLYPDEVAALLNELFRVMKSDAIIRVTVPDLEKYVRYYTGELGSDEVAIFEKKYPTGASAIRSLTQDNFHHSLWDYKELKRYLEDAGFRDIQKMAYGECSNPGLCLDQRARAYETLYVDARKI